MMDGYKYLSNHTHSLEYLDHYINKFVTCSCGSTKRKNTYVNLITKYKCGYEKRKEICYDCGNEIEFEIKYITEADVRNVKFKECDNK